MANCGTGKAFCFFFLKELLPLRGVKKTGWMQISRSSNESFRMRPEIHSSEEGKMNKRDGSDDLKQRVSTRLARHSVCRGKGMQDRARRLMKPAVLSRRAGSLTMCYACR